MEKRCSDPLLFDDGMFDVNDNGEECDPTSSQPRLSSSPIATDSFGKEVLAADGEVGHALHAEVGDEGVFSPIASRTQGLQSELTDIFNNLESELLTLLTPDDSAYTSASSLCPSGDPRDAGPDLMEEGGYMKRASSKTGVDTFEEYLREMETFNSNVKEWQDDNHPTEMVQGVSSLVLPEEGSSLVRLEESSNLVRPEENSNHPLVGNEEGGDDPLDTGMDSSKSLWSSQQLMVTSTNNPSSVSIEVDATPSSSSRWTRSLPRWKQLPRLQRVVLLMVGVAIVVALIYAIASQNESSASTQGDPVGGASPPAPQLENNLTPSPVPPNVVDPPDEGAGNVQNNDDQNNDESEKKEGADQIIPPPELPKKRNDRQEAVVAAMKHAWKGYKTYAWGHDHLKPISRTRDDWLHLGLTLVDSLDTLWIMDLKEEFKEAQEWVTTQLNFNINQDVNLFETTIRVLGGLLSSYHLSKEQIFLDKAIDLGDRLVAAFSSGSGVPYADVNLYSRRASKPKWGPDSSTSEVSTIQLEFRDLSRVTGNPIYENKAGFVTEHIHKLPKTDGLVPIFINAQTGQWRGHATITLGARGDSYYEYLIKQWVQTGRTRDYLRDDYNESISGMETHLAARTEPNNLLFFGELHGSSKNFVNKMDELTCFLPGSLILGVHYGMPKHHKKIAEELIYTCTQTWLRQPTNLAPEITYYNTQPTSMNEDFFVKSNDAHYLLRPETIESLWYMYQLTGNKTYQDWGWQMFQGIETYCKVENGYTSIGNVKSTVNTKPKDKMESFFLGETLKYLYLLFMDDQSRFSVDKWVFNTEGHPLPIYSN